MFGYLFLIKLSTFYHINFFTSLFLRISHLYNPIYRVARMVEGGGALAGGGVLNHTYAIYMRSKSISFPIRFKL